MEFLIGAYGKRAVQYLLNAYKNNTTSTAFKSSDGLACSIAQNSHQADVISIDIRDGQLLGKLFTKNTYQPITSLHLKELSADILINTYWGRYAGALYDNDSKTITLVRDPLGLSSLFYVPFEDGYLFSTHLAVLYDCLPVKPSIDYMYFAQYLLEYEFMVTETPFNGIRELMPGTCVTIDSDGKLSDRFVWNITQEKITDETQAEEIVYETLLKSTQAWLGDNKKITVELSGGVDSSSILAMIKHLAPDSSIQSVHYNDSKNASSQELDYAEQISRDCGTPLHVVDYQTIKLIGTLPASWRSSKPNTFSMFYESSTTLLEQAGTGMVFSGQGGDHVFLAPPPIESVCDYWLDRGFNGIGSITNELCSVYRTSWLEIIKTNFKALKCYYLKRVFKKDAHIDADIINKEIVAKLIKKPAYLDTILTQFHPAKAKQIRALYHAIVYADRDQRFDTKIVMHPLLSLPVVEAALKIPAYISIKNGYNRYFLRKAVSRVNDSKVLWRRNKGHVTASVLKAFQNEYDQIKDIIDNGLLIKNNILNKEWFEKKCAQIMHGDGSDLLTIMRAISAERWFKQWGL